MSDRFGSLVGSLVRSSLARLGAVALCLSVLSPPLAEAQAPRPDAPAGAEFMSRFDFRLSAAGLSYDDPRFSIDTHWGGDFDLVDYVHGRTTFLVDYQALLGNEFRPFDPYQSNYLLEAASSVRLGKTEIYGVLNHVSRHLGDRFKRFPIAENSLGVRVLRQISAGQTTIDVRLDARKVIQRSYMDYEWMGDVDLTVRRPLSQRLSLYGRGYGEMIGVDEAIAGRDRQNGGRIEAGLRLHGARGGVDLFAGYERVIDADPLDRVGRQWAFAGFRVLGR